MPIVSNPQVQRIVVPVGNAKVVLVLRGYTTVEYARFMGSKYGLGKSGQLDDRSMLARIDFIDTLLVGIEACDEEGQPDEIFFLVDGKEEKLAPQVENWKTYVNPSWKLSAAFELEARSAEIEDHRLKN